MAQQPVLNVDISQIDPDKCSCGNQLFSQVYLVRTISPIISGQPKPVKIAQPIFVCTHCGKPNDPGVIFDQNGQEDTDA